MAVQADTRGTLYLNWSFEPDADTKLAEDIYRHTLPIALLAALTDGLGARVAWDQDDEIAERVMTAVATAPGRLQ